jgi:hypothetical protein
MQRIKISVLGKSCPLALGLLGLAIGGGFAQVIGPTRGPYVSIISPPNHAVFYAPVDIPIFATVRGFAAGATNVEFYAGTNDLGPGHRILVPRTPTYPLPPYPPIIYPLNEYELVWSNAPVGTNVLRAVVKSAFLPATATSTSAPVNITILPPPPPPTNRPVLVNIVATDPVAIEGTNCWVWRGLTNATPTWTNWPVAVLRFYTNCGPKNATFTINRIGATNDPVTVAYSIGGTATNGVDYVTLPGVVTIPAGQRSAAISIVPIDDGTPDISSDVILTLTASTNAPPDYLLTYPQRAAVIIIDSNKPRPLTSLVSDHVFHLGSTGPDGAWFCVQYTSNMVDWVPICTNQVVNGSIDFVDPDSPGDASRFYRAVPQ